MKRTTAVRVICIILALIFVLSLLTVILPAGASAVTQSEIDALQAKRDQIRAQQVEQQNQIDGLRNQQAGVLEQKAALDAETNLTQEEINVVDINYRRTTYDEWTPVPSGLNSEVLLISHVTDATMP